ncbi:MAG: TerC family protein, partial [Alphaproteobacteria bacterium]|nr:TerC family protein [Alphaproteobacteria bacterium]
MDHTFLLGSFMGEPVWMWLSFAAVVIALLVFDLGFMHRKDREVGMKESLLFSAFYISVGLLFGAWIWLELGSVKAIEYYTGFIVEKTLSIDNIFVMTMLFSFFRIPGKYQHRVLFWGVLGAIILRGLIIGLGSVLVSQFAWILDVFAVFLIFTGIKMLWTKKEEGADVGHNLILSFIQRHFRV